MSEAVRSVSFPNPIKHLVVRGLPDSPHPSFTMKTNCSVGHLKSITLTTSMTTSASPSRVSTAAIVGAVVFGGQSLRLTASLFSAADPSRAGMFLGLLTVLFYAGWAHNRGLDPTSPQRRFEFPRLGAFRAWIDPQAQMFSVSLGTSRSADDAELGPRSHGRPIVARPARVLHEPLPPYEHPPSYGLGDVERSISEAHSTLADDGIAPDSAAGRGPL